jgi:ATP/maltotriose-dependent transcriptional regulator MalT
MEHTKEEIEKWNNQIEWVLDDYHNGIISTEEANYTMNRLQREMNEKNIPIE